MTNFPRLLEALVNGGVEFVIIGGNLFAVVFSSRSQT